METLFDLVLVAAALYGAKAYLTAPEVVTDREIFSSRGSMFVKRLVGEQAGQGLQTPQTPAFAPSEPAVVEPEPIADLTDAAQEPQLVETETAAAAEPQAMERDAAISAVTEISQAPQDSVLNRHYWAQRAAERAALAQPYPTDSVLLRHYRQIQAASLHPTTHAAALTAMQPEAVAQATEATGTSAAIPEDSVLKRHFLANARHLIEQNYGPVPSDSVLSRHHRQLVAAALADYLAELA
ncbi:hypothetical protein [Methylomonas koyamae]|uniref:hypothetical protein n=1 Tax=Methylomonas koyamae TaxID=702114 RepID=UPI0006D266B2|nr:hypothetical protein [Methylomonas koyamae]BBL56656.1 hypothetical protein MKFW12EY_02690 [Methylomonas koyamae]